MKSYIAFLATLFMLLNIEASHVGNTYLPPYQSSPIQHQTFAAPSYSAYTGYQAAPTYIAQSYLPPAYTTRHTARYIAPIRKTITTYNKPGYNIYNTPIARQSYTTSYRAPSYRAYTSPSYATSYTVPVAATYSKPSYTPRYSVPVAAPSYTTNTYSSPSYSTGYTSGIDTQYGANGGYIYRR